MFADDINLLGSLNVFKDDHDINNFNVSQNINKELTKVSDWLAVNKLSLNIQKTKIMFFNFKQQNQPTPVVKINNTEIESVNSFKFLGVHIDDKLTWHTHVNCISNKLSRINGMICRLKHQLPTNILRTIYCALFYSQINYGISSWGFANSTLLNRVIKLQKKVIRNITKSKYNAHTAELFKSLNLLKFQDVIKMSCTKFYYKYKHETLPIFFHHILTPPANTQNPHPRPIRNIQAPRRLEETDATTYNDTLLATIHTNTKSSRHCLKHNLISLINTHDIPKDITDQINTLSYTAFSNTL